MRLFEYYLGCDGALAADQDRTRRRSRDRDALKVEVFGWDIAIVRHSVHGGIGIGEDGPVQAAHRNGHIIRDPER